MDPYCLCMATKRLSHTPKVPGKPHGLRKLQTWIQPATQKALRVAAAAQDCSIGKVIDDVVADTISRFIDVEGLANDPAMTKGNHAA